jgi:hypothetical protein
MLEVEPTSTWAKAEPAAVAPVANKNPLRAFQRCSPEVAEGEEGVLKSQSQHMVGDHNQEVVISHDLIIEP